MGPQPAVALVRHAVRTALHGIDEHGVGERRVLVACSGGADSLALAAATAFLARRTGLGAGGVSAGFAAGLVTVDHGLQDGSARQAARTAQLGYDLGLDPVITVRVDVGTHGGPEAAARTARYAALESTAAGLDAVVLLGHTLDDQAETVLLGLGRGSGPRSLAGMARRRGRYLRPLLGLRRADTAAACAELGLPVWHDPHNDDRSLQRVRVRSEVLPLLDEVLQGGVPQALARTAELWRDDLEALDQWAAQACSNAVVNGALDVGAVAGLPVAVRTRVIRGWIAADGPTSLSAERTAAVDELITAWHGQGPVDLPGGVRVHRSDGRLTLAQRV